MQVYTPYGFNVGKLFTDSSYAVMNEVGTRWSITCTSPDGTASTRWTIGGSVINRAQGNVVGLHVDPVNDMHHNEEYVCLGLNSGGAIVYQLHFTLIVHGKESLLKKHPVLHVSQYYTCMYHSTIAFAM